MPRDWKDLNTVTPLLHPNQFKPVKLSALNKSPLKFLGLKSSFFPHSPRNLTMLNVTTLAT